MNFKMKCILTDFDESSTVNLFEMLMTFDKE